MRSPIRLVVFILLSVQIPLNTKFSLALSLSAQEVNSNRAKDYLTQRAPTRFPNPIPLDRPLNLSPIQFPSRDLRLQMPQQQQYTPPRPLNVPPNLSPIQLPGRPLNLERIQLPGREPIYKIRELTDEERRQSQQYQMRQQEEVMRQLGEFIEREQKKREREEWERQQRFQQTLNQQQLTPREPTPRQIAAQILQYGIQLYQNSKFYAAIDMWLPARDIYRREGDSNGEATVLKNLGNAYNSVGQYAKAIETLQSSLTIFRTKNNRKGEIASLIGLGDAYHSLGQYAKAKEFYQQSLTIARTIGDRDGEARAMTHLGRDNASTTADKYLESIELLQEALVIAKDSGDPTIEVDALNNLATAYISLDQGGKAVILYEEALKRAREIGSRSKEARTLNNLGSAYFSLWQSKKTLDLYSQALTIFREIGARRGEGEVLNNMAFALFRTGHLAEAEKHLLDAITIWESLRSGEAPDKNKASVFKNKQPTYADSLQLLAQGSSLESSPLAELSDEDKISLFETQQTTYRLLQQVLIAQNKPENALEIAERGRARALVELLEKRLSSAPANLGDLSSSSNDNLPNLPMLFTETLAQSQNITRIQNSPLVDWLFNNNTPNSAKLSAPTLAQIQQIAKIQNSTIVQYSIIYDDFNSQGQTQTKESELYIWVIKPTGETTFRKVDLKLLQRQQNTSLSELVFTSHDTIGVRAIPIVTARPYTDIQQREQANLTQQLQQLHKILIEPIANQLPTDPNAKVIFIPQRELFLVSFPALQDQQGKYLIEKHTILTAPSIQVLAFTREQRQKVSTGEVLVVGNPTMPSVPWEIGQPPAPLPSLPGAEREAKAIAPMFNSQPLIGNAATKASVMQQLPKARVIHLATHGLLDNIQGLGGTIALAPSGSDNGLLTADEILNLKLKAELVVLSACDTGRGRITGDGVAGLSRSLIIAGVPSVIVSLWAVPDAPTASLMTEFYQNWQNNPNKAQALRQAMLTIMKQHPDPKNWAAFTLIGEAN